MRPKKSPGRLRHPSARREHDQTSRAPLLAGLVVVLVFCGIAARKSEPAPVTIQRLFPAPVAEVATSKTSPLRTASPTVDARLERLMDRIAADPRSADARAALATLRREASKRRVDAVPARRR